MKIQCDVCNKADALVYCTADDAALCDGCDHRVHHANKLASKHHRFSLLNPSSKQFPICDICQEKRGLIFCQQDRAILCSDCDITIHSTNEHTKKHNRFLLTGVKLSNTACPYNNNSINGCDLTVPDQKKPQSIKTNDVSVSGLLTNNINQVSTTSSISEYLQMLPGWHVEDLLDSSQYDDGKLAIMESDDQFGQSNNSTWSTDDMGDFWAPKGSSPVYCQYDEMSQIDHGKFGFKEMGIVKGNERMLADRDCFQVPQISPSHIAGSKRARTYW